jgi:general secretion pathway protein M
VTMAISLPTGRHGQMLALVLTGLLIAGLWVGIVAPLLGAYSNRTETLLNHQSLARRMEELVQALPSLRKQAMAAAGAGQQTGALLPGTTDSLAAAALQQKVDDLAKVSDLHIGTEEIVPAQASGAFRTIGVRITLHAPYRMLITLLRSLAQAEIPMVVSDLSIRAPTANTRDPEVPVDAGFTVSALRSASSQTANKAVPPAKAPGSPAQP